MTGSSIWLYERLSYCSFIWVKSKRKLERCDIFLKKIMTPFYGWRSTTSRLEPLWRDSLLFTTSSQKFPVLTLSTSEGWKTEPTLEHFKCQYLIKTQTCQKKMETSCSYFSACRLIFFSRNLFSKYIFAKHI